jgi:hypothetical protein
MRSSHRKQDPNCLALPVQAMHPKKSGAGEFRNG